MPYKDVEKNRSVVSQWQKDNRERHAAKQKRWREQHPDESRARQRNINLARRGVPGEGVSALQWRLILDFWGNSCAICRSKNQIQKGHVVPLSQGGWHSITNVVPLCLPCNYGQGSGDFYEFAVRRGVTGPA